MFKVRQKIWSVFPPFVMLSGWGGSPELSQLLSSMFSHFLSLMIFSIGIESLRFLFFLIFLPDFSQKFSTRCYLQLPSLPHCCSFSRAASGLHGGFSRHVFIRHSPVTFLHLPIFAQGFVYLLYLLCVHMFWGRWISHNCTVWVFFFLRVGVLSC